MPVTVEYDQGHGDVFRFELTGQWTWEQLLEQVTESIRMCDPNVRNDVIVNLANANHVPPDALGKFRKITRTTPMNGGMYCIVGTNSLTSALIEVFRRVYKEGRAWRVVRTIDEARALINHDRLSAHSDSA